MKPQLHLIKSLYVPDAKVLVIRSFEDLCRENGFKFSEGVIKLIEAALATKGSRAPTPITSQRPALENQVTIKARNGRARAAEADEKWKSRKK